MYARPGNELDQLEDIQLEELYSKLKRYCRFLSQNDWDSEDLAHEAFRKACEHYELNVNLTLALLKKIAHNLWLDQLKKRNREVVGTIPESIIEQHECSKDVAEYLVNLTPKQSVIFTLKEGFKYQISEIAEIFQMKETAVKAILHRAKNRLKTISDNKDLPLLLEVCDQRLRLDALLLNAIVTEDPTLLIRHIPQLFQLVKLPKPKASPSSFLSMAA